VEVVERSSEIFTRLGDTSKAVVFSGVATSLSYTAHDGAWNTLGAFTLTANPVVLNEYPVGDNAILIMVGTAVAAAWLGRKANRELRSEGDLSKGEQYVAS
jgi:hypothetical protein